MNQPGDLNCSFTLDLDDIGPFVLALLDPLERIAWLAILRAPIDAFFDQVTVNDADPVKRAARLGLLDAGDGRIQSRDLYAEVFDARADSASIRSVRAILAGCAPRSLADPDGWG